MSDSKKIALNLMHQMLGDGASFREGQWDAIESVVVHKRRTLVVQRTGWGKSIIYFIAAKMLRDQGSGITLIISPLLSLMRNQIEAAQKIGINAATINSSNQEEWAQIEAELNEGKYDILLISPERLANQDFLKFLTNIKEAIAMLVVDEAHCISDWGHDFRPDYRRIIDIIKTMPPNIPILATTATANSRVVEDIKEQLGPELFISRGPLIRESLRLQIIHLDDQAERLAWLAENLNQLPGSGIIYCLTVADCRRVSEWLKSNKLDVAEYTGKLDNSIREILEQKLIHNEVKALVATVALGMGFDKPDLGFVVHYQRPSSVIAYYQQIGRAGRALDTAYAILLAGREDDEIGEYFINSALPSFTEMSKVVEALEESEQGLTINEMMAKVNYSKGRIERTLKILEIEGIVAKNKSSFYRTINPWKPDSLHYDSITALRRSEMQQMQEFTRTSVCYMKYISKELDDPYACQCNQCANCRGDYFHSNVSDTVVQEAIHFLRRDYLSIEPRKQWPVGGIDHRKGRIKEDQRNEVGKILCMYGDAGWGRLVSQNKFGDGYFSDELVNAMSELVAFWNPSPHPTWVTAVPSLRRPELVSGLAKRLAEKLGIPFIPSLIKVKETAEQKTMNNSMRQAMNLKGAFAIEGPVPEGPVLLVDDMIDSGWTMTICGALLREAGSGKVFPIALASTAGRGDSE
ncbi:RecQ family ATP-dependent DNA helicase [Desulfitobacterium sp.]|uniref:RecQ family ATP-dependent DNA helicase n=1 Tax=Desulfitobacterium sp. TaxID=49981 RepID=UPI002B1F1592|nr:RecQ family ATP-dependent DNA helicase [Desulfitobacterium sp.]MEA4903057.1 RecQ family ATP-dependent DNA helicase [Desulfitobacterium sp.]